jgi:hypothetical protein
MPICPRVIYTIMIHPKPLDPLLHPFCINRRPFAHGICTKFNGNLSFGGVDQAVFIPLAAVTGFPGGCTQIAEARTAPAGNVEATLIQLYDVLAIGTGLPLQRSSERSDL